MKKTFYKIETDLGQLYIDKDEFEDIKYRVNNVSPWNTDLDGNPVRFHEETQEFPDEIIIVGSTRLIGKRVNKTDEFKLEVISHINELKEMKGAGEQAKIVLNYLLDRILEINKRNLK
jgi:hypothetical protein